MIKNTWHPTLKTYGTQPKITRIIGTIKRTITPRKGWIEISLYTKLDGLDDHPEEQ